MHKLCSMKVHQVFGSASWLHYYNYQSILHSCYVKIIYHISQRKVHQVLVLLHGYITLIIRAFSCT